VGSHHERTPDPIRGLGEPQMIVSQDPCDMRNRTSPLTVIWCHVSAPGCTAASPTERLLRGTGGIPGTRLRHSGCTVASVAKPARKSTLLDLLAKIQQQDGQASERDLVSRVIKLVRTGRVVLNGTYRGTRTLK
jgi:hypothetical protein